MAFSSAERERRDGEIRKIMDAKELKALMLLGDTNVGNDILGDFRYYVDNRVIAGRQVAILFPQAEPVLFMVTGIQQQAAQRRSSVRDCRVTEDTIAEVIKLLKERGVSSGKVGVNLHVLPVAWYESLKKEIPGVDLVETHKEILEVRFRHVSEEADLFRRCASLGDGSFDAAAKMIKPGVSEYEIAAALEGYSRARGAEQHFTLVGSGKFAFGEKNNLPLPYAPSGRRVEAGDSVVLEITPCLEGYWTQIVRTVNVGEPNAELEKLYVVARDAIKKGMEVFRPGKTIRDVVEAMSAYVSGRGYLPRPPFGHICGTDLIDGRVSPANSQPLDPGMAVIIHPTVVTPDGKDSFFWGETYLVTEDGYERINHVTDELLTV